MQAATRQREYALVLYGATGFVGRQAVAYLAQQVDAAQLPWGIAGRDRTKLETVREQAGGSALRAPIFVADGQDRPAIDAFVGRTAIVLNLAGPFARYGDAIVAACVAQGTHYVDITGETPWIRRLIDAHHERAAEQGTRIIPACGFDSIPSDLGAFLMARYMARELGSPCHELQAFFQLRGGFNGGTMASLLEVFAAGDWKLLREPFLLNPDRKRAVRHPLDPDVAKAHYDAELNAWLAPFFMAPVNTRVVRRSMALGAGRLPDFGPPFPYQEYLKVTGPRAQLLARGLALGTSCMPWLLRQRWGRAGLARLLPSPGTGPSEETRDAGWFRCQFRGHTADGRVVEGEVRDRGDPGNRVTVKCVCEAALTLALHEDELPGGPTWGGLLTPATGLGDPLLTRLRRAGMRLHAG